MGQIVLELNQEEYQELARQLITAEGYASSKARLYRDWAVEMPTEAQRDTAKRMADEMEAEYVAAMGLRDKLYRAAAVVGRKEEETE